MTTAVTEQLNEMQISRFVTASLMHAAVLASTTNVLPATAGRRHARAGDLGYHQLLGPGLAAEIEVVNGPTSPVISTYRKQIATVRIGWDSTGRRHHASCTSGNALLENNQLKTAAAPRGGKTGHIVRP